MSRNKRIICALMACMVTWSMAFAEEGAVEPTAVPEMVAEATAVPTAEPTAELPAEATEAPISETTAEPTTEPTTVPTSAPTVEPTAEPTAEPTSEPTSEPTAEPTAEPTVEPTAEPTAEPTVEPTTEPTPTVTPAVFEVKAEGNAQLVDNVWQISCQSPEEQITFQWTNVETATAYEVRISDGSGNELHVSRESKNSITLPASMFGTDSCKLAVSVYEDTELLVQGKLSFVIIQGQTMPGGDFPGGGFPGGGRPGGGGMPSGGMQDGAMPEEQGFRVTPGEALTSSHSSGTKTMKGFGTLEIAVSESEMTILTLDNTELAVLLDGQSNGFYAVQEENTLILTPASEGTEWSVNAYALKILNRSGIESLRLMLGETAIEIATGWQLQGSVYGRLTAAGYVSKDYTMYVTENDMIVAVNGENYRINQNYELVGG